VRHGPTAEQENETGPATRDVLQFPSTASSGRKLIFTSAGDSYFLF
jgi:hypothetical protein